MALRDRYRYAIAILIKEHRPLGPFELFSTFVLIMVIPDLASTERRSLSPILTIYLDISCRLSPVAQRTFSYIKEHCGRLYKDSGNTRTFRGRSWAFSSSSSSVWQTDRPLIIIG